LRRGDIEAGALNGAAICAGGIPLFANNSATPPSGNPQREQKRTSSET
jgi:hypothetical protein